MSTLGTFLKVQFWEFSKTKSKQKGMSVKVRKIGEQCVLSELKIGQTAKILNININNVNVKRHLLDMGLTKGTKVRIKKIAPMGDPIDVEIRGYELAMRKEDLKQIKAEVIK